MLKKLRRYRDTIRHKPTDSDSDPYDPMPPKPYASPVASRTTSRTLYYAQQDRSLIPSAVKAPPSYARSGGVASRPSPDSSAARYWAARAVTAEVLLAERNKHAHELRGVINEEDAKRREEIAALHRANEARQKKMEWAVICCIAVLAVVLLCLLVIHTLASSRTPARGATHFTIPVLSPFTSVVEHETSAFGARTIVPGLMIVATLAWAVFRHWTSQKWLR
ncbi:hypothetical protein EI94DRAFT_1743096 [Lactarius quietus]|nr:hypothetical protein EI94DRAFT_1743096 [Lactarius quietus]